MSGPKYLTGDKAAIDKFIDQFDVSHHIYEGRLYALANESSGLSIRLRWYASDQTIAAIGRVATGR